MNIAQDNPVAGVEHIELRFPITDEYGTGSFTMLVRNQVFDLPQILTVSQFNEPLFAIRADLDAAAGSILIGLGRADGSDPQVSAFMLPRFLQRRKLHKIEVSFRSWCVTGVMMDRTPLVHAQLPQEVIFIDESIAPLVTAAQLLRPQGSLVLHVVGSADVLGNKQLFQLAAPGYDFQLFTDASDLVARRCGYEVRAPLGGDARRTLWLTWSPTSILVSVMGDGHTEDCEALTPTAHPPKSLRQLARFKKLAPTTSFPSVEAFRTAVHEALVDLQDDIREQGAYNGFWDQSYEGRSKGTPRPKRETDIHRQLLLPLNDWAKTRAVEIVPEHDTAAGRLDFCFIGSVDGQGPTPICAEVKLAHAGDLEHGLEKQLPAYMAAKRAQYGMFIVLWFKGEWFDRPSNETLRKLHESVIPGDGEPPSPESSHLDYVLRTKTVLTPSLGNVTVFVLDMTKPISASKI